jgi:multiple sugar transport system ATP-binding protein
MARVELQAIRKSYASVPVVHGVDLDIEDGEFCVLVGPSGCGKTTLMRMVAGLETISGGTLKIGDVIANDLPPQQRNISMVFQSYALYPHLNAYDNMAFGPKLRGEDKADTETRIQKAARILNLGDYLKRLPRALSGGQRQRVAMGRAIVREPSLFLFDEPLSNLDAKLRVQMRAEIKALHQRLKNTVIYVTHDQIEAMTLADRIVVMNGGRIEQMGKPLELYDKPVNLFVAGFLGSPSMSTLKGTLAGDATGPYVELDGGGRFQAPITSAKVGHKVIVGVRPEHVKIVGTGEGIAATVDVVEPTGSETHFYAIVGNNKLTAVSHERVPLSPGETINLAIDPRHLHLFDADSGQRLD